MHIDVERDGNIAKFWLQPVRLQGSGGFNRREISRIIEDNHEILLKSWYEFFDH